MLFAFGKSRKFTAAKAIKKISNRNEVEFKEIGDNYWRFFCGRSCGKPDEGIMVNRCISL
jgi:hypothetical protein